VSRERPSKNKDMLVSLSAPVLEVLPISPEKGPMMTRTEDDVRRCCGTSNERSLSCPAGHLMTAAKIRSSSQHEEDGSNRVVKNNSIAFGSRKSNNQLNPIPENSTLPAQIHTASQQRCSRRPKIPRERYPSVREIVSRGQVGDLYSTKKVNCHEHDNWNCFY